MRFSFPPEEPSLETVPPREGAAHSDASSPHASSAAAAAMLPPLRGDRVWIAWEEQRRTLNLSKRLGARLLLCLDEGLGRLRYPVSIVKTARELSRRRGQTVVAQNPSMLLAALACLLKKPFGYFLVVDRHSNFGFLSGAGQRPAGAGPGYAGTRPGLKRRLSDLLSGFTLRKADLTLVTNAELRDHVEKEGGRGFVLPDPFPVPLEPPGRNVAETGPGSVPPPRSEGAPRVILFVSSWAFDEPIAQVMEACRRLRGQVTVRITGRMKPAYARLVRDAPDNFAPTGFLSDREYFDMMAGCDAVMAVTDRAATLVCGGYEGAALGKPLILGDSAALRTYFDEGCVYTDGSAPDLEAQIRKLIADLPAYAMGIRRFHARRRAEWDLRLAELESILSGPPPGSPYLRKGRKSS